MRKNFGLKRFNQENLIKFLTKFIFDPQFKFNDAIYYCQNILSIFVALHANGNNKIPPNEWKLTETISLSFQKFMNRDSLTDIPYYSDLLLHDRIFTSQLKDQYPGFNNYRSSPHIHLMFQYIQSYFYELDEFKGNNSSLYTQEYSDYFMKYYLLQIIKALVHYVTDLQNEDSEVSEDANELYISLQEETEDLRQEGIQQCSQFIMDLFNAYFIRSLRSSMVISK